MEDKLNHASPVESTESGALNIKNAIAAPSITLLFDSILIPLGMTIKVLKITPNASIIIGK